MHVNVDGFPVPLTQMKNGRRVVMLLVLLLSSLLVDRGVSVLQGLRQLLIPLRLRQVVVLSSLNSSVTQRFCRLSPDLLHLKTL